MQSTQDLVDVEAGQDATRGRGRPQARSDEQTRALIVAAASEEFLSKGFTDGSMDAVARRAGVSKKTIYRLFASKIDLLREILQGRRQALLAAADSVAARNQPLVPALRMLLQILAGLVLKPDAVEMNRLCAAESHRLPDVAAAFYEEGPLRTIEALADWLRSRCERGELELEDPSAAASLLLSMVVAEPLRAATLGARPLPTQAEIERRIDLSMEIFLRGCARR